MICRSRRFVGRRGDLETRRRGREEESRLLGSDLLRCLEDLRRDGCQWVIPNLKAPTPKEVITHLPTVFGSEIYQLQDSGRRGRTGVSVSKYKRCLDNPL